MKSSRPFWVAVLGGVALIVLGYMGFLAAMPDKTSFNLAPLCLLCALAVLTGVVVLIGTLCYAIAKTVRRRSSRREA